MKAPINQVLIQTFLLIVLFSKTYLKTLSCTFYEQKYLPFLCNLFQVFHQLAFKCSINQFFEYHHLTKATATRLSTNFTFVVQRISKWKFPIIFFYTEVLFPRHSESNRTHVFLEQAVQSVQKPFFRNIQKKNFLEGKCTSPKSKQHFRKKISVMKFVLFLIMSGSSVFSSIARPLLLCKRSNIT